MDVSLPFWAIIFTLFNIILRMSYPRINNHREANLLLRLIRSKDISLSGMLRLLHTHFTVLNILLVLGCLSLFVFAISRFHELYAGTHLFW